MNELLKQSITVNGVELANRLVMPPMATGKSDDGKVSQELIDYYDKMSQGGYIGLIITEHSYINRNGIAGANQVSVAEDSDIEGLKKIADVIHKNGSKAVLQMNHAGERKPGNEALSVSGIPNPRAKKDEVKELHILTKEEIKGITEDFVNAAKRVKAAGFDGVEIHCAHSYLLNQFYSPLTNHRTDEYGGCVENRVRAVQEVIHAVREAVGKDYLVVLRLGACDYLEGGNTIEDALAAAKILEKEIDLLDVSGGMNGYVIPGLDQPGYFKEVTALFKKELSVPVILAGGVTTAEQANTLIEEGCADMIGVARAMLKDPEWAKKEMRK